MIYEFIDPFANSRYTLDFSVAGYIRIAKYISPFCDIRYESSRVIIGDRIVWVEDDIRFKSIDMMKYADRLAKLLAFS